MHYISIIIYVHVYIACVRKPYYSNGTTESQCYIVHKKYNDTTDKGVIFSYSFGYKINRQHALQNRIKSDITNDPCTKHGFAHMLFFLSHQYSWQTTDPFLLWMRGCETWPASFQQTLWCQIHGRPTLHLQIIQHSTLFCKMLVTDMPSSWLWNKCHSSLWCSA